MLQQVMMRQEAYIASADFDLETTSGNIESSSLEVDTKWTDFEAV